MIRLNVFIRTTDSNREEVVNTAKELVAASLKDEGCVAYDLFESTTRKDVLMICETWSDAKALTEELNRAFSVTNAWLWRIQGDIGTVSEEQYLLYNAVSTTYGSYTALVGQLEEAVASGEDAQAAQLYYNKIGPCGG